MRFDPQADFVALDAAVEVPPADVREPDYYLAGTTLRSPIKTALVIVVIGILGGVGIWLWGEGAPGQNEAVAQEKPVGLKPESVAVIRFAEAMTGAGNEQFNATNFGELNDIRSKMAPRHRRGKIREVFENGKMYMAMGQHAQAVPYFIEAVKLDPQFAEAHYRLGLAYVHTGKADLAKDEYRALKKLDSDKASLLAFLID